MESACAISSYLLMTRRQGEELQNLHCDPLIPDSFKSVCKVFTSFLCFMPPIAMVDVFLMESRERVKCLGLNRTLPQVLSL